jgi:hypothetical protein
LASLRSSSCLTSKKASGSRSRTCGIRSIEVASTSLTASIPSPVLHETGRIPTTFGYFARSPRESMFIGDCSVLLATITIGEASAKLWMSLSQYSTRFCSSPCRASIYKHVDAALGEEELVSGVHDLLPAEVPDAQEDRIVVDLDAPATDLDARGLLLVLGEVTGHETLDQRRLADRTLADHEQLRLVKPSGRPLHTFEVVHDPRRSGHLRRLIPSYDPQSHRGARCWHGPRHLSKAPPRTRRRGSREAPPRRSSAG